jgi:hypothetical protein
MFEYAIKKTRSSLLFGGTILAVWHQLTQILPQVVGIAVPLNRINLLLGFLVNDLVESQLEGVVYHAGYQLLQQGRGAL